MFLLEDGSNFLLEDGTHFLLEGGADDTGTTTGIPAIWSDMGIGVSIGL